MGIHRPAPGAYGGLGKLLLGFGWSLVVIGIILVALRFHNASRKADRFRWDFIWISIAIVFGLLTQCSITISVAYGLGNHISLSTYASAITAAKWAWITIFVGVVSFIAGKFAIIALLIQVQGPNAVKRKWLLYGVGFCVAMTGIIQLILSATKCRPMARIFNPFVPGDCPLAAEAQRFSYFWGSMSAFSDIFLAFYPATIVWNLQTTRNVKIGFVALMASGAIPSIAAIFRTINSRDVTYSRDPTWDLGRFIFWASLELYTVIIIGCIPPLRPVFISFYHRLCSPDNLTSLASITRFSVSRMTNNTRNKDVTTLTTTSFACQDIAEKGNLNSSITQFAAKNRECESNDRREIEKTVVVSTYSAPMSGESHVQPHGDGSYNVSTVDHDDVRKGEFGYYPR